MFRFLHIFLILNILIASYGIPVFEHHCKRLGSQFSFYLKSKSCCSGKKQTCHNLKPKIGDQTNSITQLTKAACCHNKTSFTKSNSLATQLLKNNYAKYFNLPNYFFANPILIKNSLDFFIPKIFFSHYDSLPGIKDILLMIRVFRC